MSEIVTFGKDVTERPYLPHAGTYGQGLDYDADVEISSFEWMTENKPGYAREGEEFALFVIKVIFNGQVNFLRHHEPLSSGSGSDIFKILSSIGVDVNETEDGYAFDPSSVAPRKITGVQVADPREYREKMYTGNLVGLKIIG